MSDRVLDMPLDHLNCFAVVLREMHGMVDSAKLIIVFTPNKEFSLILMSYMEVQHSR